MPGILSAKNAAILSGGGIISNSENTGAQFFTGEAYPGLSVNSNKTGQWYVGGLAVAGQIGKSYTVRIRDIGLSLYQVAGGKQSRILTCWHPRDEAGVSLVLLGNAGVFNSVSPDVPAADNQTVRRWVDQSANGYFFDQATASNQPLCQVAEINGNDTLQSDGTNDFLAVPGPALNLFRNVSEGYLFALVSDTNRTAGATSHYVARFSTGLEDAKSRLSLLTRQDASANMFTVLARNADAGPLTIVSAASTAGYHLLTAQALYSSGIINLQVDGVQVATGSIAPGNTSDTTSVGGSLLGYGTSTLPGHVGVLIAGSDMAPDSVSRIGRFIMLYADLPTLIPYISPP